MSNSNYVRVLFDLIQVCSEEKQVLDAQDLLNALLYHFFCFLL